MEISKFSKEDFRFALSEFGKGEIFEDFAKSFLSHVLGYDFIPVGGTKDKGIDAKMRLYNSNSHKTFIYQISTELNYERKINDAIETLLKNDIDTDRLVYITGRQISDKHKLEDDFLEEHKIPLQIFDLEWFATNVVDDERLIKLYYTFIESNVHEFRKGDKSYYVGNYIEDPRLFVFLRQQFDYSESSKDIEEKLADSLILFALEGTASETETFKNLDEIKSEIAHLVKFNPKSLYSTIEKRLGVISQKPRLINYHAKVDGYCLPYETRVELAKRDVEEQNIYTKFHDQTLAQLKALVKKEDVVVTKLTELIQDTIHKIYYSQGLEFASFVIDGKSRDIIEEGLPNIIAEVVDNSHVVMKNKEEVKQALLMTIRKISYNGTNEQKEYLRRLSYTYNMMFILKWDPHLASAFQSLASQLKIFVGTSIIIPALSEVYLKKNMRRYWNLIEGAHLAGVKLSFNQTILQELVNHFRMVNSNYKSLYKENEEMYLQEEILGLYVDEIIIRAYFYAKSHKQVDSFKEFIENFASPNFSNLERDLKEFLIDEFHMEFEDTSQIEAKIDEEERIRLVDRLTEMKNSKGRAETDARLMLMVYKKREINKEEEVKKVFGYKTWWLSKDIYTYKAIKDVFGQKYNVNCYMRSDFLLNYISMAPKKKEVDNMFKEIFPSMLGINLSYHLPKEVCQHINKSINDHSTKSTSTIKRTIRNFTEQLITSDMKNSTKLSSFFDEELKKQVKADKNSK